MGLEQYLKARIGKKKKRRRGPAAGGKTCGRGTKGQKARKSGHVRPGFEGGQTPIYRRLPKRGFTSHTKKEIRLINLETLEKDKEIFDGQVLDFTQGKKTTKILGQGILRKKLIVQASAFSRTAREKIEKAGGKIKLI